MTLHTKQAGAYGKVKKSFAKVEGVWTKAVVKKGFVRQGVSWTQFFASEIVATVAANINNLNLSTLFAAADWASDTQKRVVISAGVIVGATAVSAAALTTGAGLGGLLTLDNAGDIRAAGGAVNGGAGGNAIMCSTVGVTINNAGFIRSGGGGGGYGGTGGAGGTGYYYSNSAEQYTGSGGQNYQATNASYAWVGQETSQVRWAGSSVWIGAGNPGSVSVGAYTYIRGSQRSTFLYNTNKNGANYGVIQQSTVYVGGAGGGGGGAGGLGQGANQARTGGKPGAGGGNNGGNSGTGGTGGTGGLGGDWGTAGSPGAVGNNGAGGNAAGGGAGTAGGGGGPAGLAITGKART